MMKIVDTEANSVGEIVRSSGVLGQDHHCFNSMNHAYDDHLTIINKSATLLPAAEYFQSRNDDSKNITLKINLVMKEGDHSHQPILNRDEYAFGDSHRLAITQKQSSTTMLAEDCGIVRGQSKKQETLTFSQKFLDQDREVSIIVTDNASCVARSQENIESPGKQGFGKQVDFYNSKE